MMSWPPDDGFHNEWRAAGVELKSTAPETDQVVLIIARMQHHGAIVLFGNRFWWCPLASLRGEPSGSVETKP